MNSETERDGSGGAEGLEHRVRNSMQNVLDPCSCMTDSPVNIVELGLVQTIDISDDTVDICLVPTTPMCTYMTQIMEDVENSVGQVDGVESVEVTQDLKTMWTPERMSDELHGQWVAGKPTMERPSRPGETSYRK